MRKSQPHYKVDRKKFRTALLRHGLTAMGMSLASYHNGNWLTGMVNVHGYLTEDAAKVLEENGIKREEWEDATERN